MSKPPPPPLHLGGTAASPHSTGADGPPPPPSSSATPTTQSHHSASTPNGNANHPHPGSSASSSPSSAGTTQGAATTAPTAAQPAAPPAYPALHLTPLNGTFVPKQISLDHTTSGGGGGRVKIGRQINAKTVPNATNGYFDSKVLSRAHAEVWSEDGKVFIKDVKSSNGTFINGERLSPESTESDVFELHTDDIVEFGIDILTDDTKQIVHHKVAAKVHLVLNAEDAIASHRRINNWYRSAGEQSLNRSRATAPPRSSGGGGGGGLPSSQSGLSFEHVLSRLQGELQKSRDTGVNLTDVNSTLTVVQDTFSGGPAPSLPPGAGIPRGFSNPRNGGQQHTQQQQQQQQQLQLQQQAANEAHAQSIAALQAQLNETQSSLQGHVGKIRELEGLLAEHDTIKREVGGLRAQIELAQESMSALMRDRERQGYGRGGAATNGRESPLARMLEAGEEEEDEDRGLGGRKGGDLGDDGNEEEEEEEEDDDTRSIVSVETVTSAATAPPRLLNGGGDDKRRQRGPTPLDADADDDGAPTSSPPPSSTPALVISDDGDGTQQGPSNADALAASNKRERLLEEQNGKLVARLEALSVELSEATQLGAALRTRHAEASETIKLLEERIVALERAVDQRVAEAEGKVLAKVEQTWTGWRERFEQSWKEERLSWEGEREALRKLVKEWEERKRLEAVEMAASREAAARNRAGEEEDQDDEEEDGSSSGSDDIADPSSTLSPVTGSPARTSSKKSRSSRRRKRSSLTPVPPSISGPSASARLSELARHVVDGRGGADGVGAGGGGGVASDSDSTIGEPLGGGDDGAGGNRFKEDGVSSRAGLGGSASSASSGQDVTRGSGKAGEHGGLPLSVAGAVVVLAVAVGYGAAMKLKE
ncbi:hypothetical protein B0A53_05464 [Rhodotorula sp. CCFEE 5036]|nr:hypothetical protein B0A53_05464 [Rhodotorula sp. CCFEE 5036]